MAATSHPATNPGGSRLCRVLFDAFDSEPSQERNCESSSVLVVGERREPRTHGTVSRSLSENCAGSC